MKEKIDFEVGDTINGARVTKVTLSKVYIGESWYVKHALCMWIKEGMIKYKKGRLSCKSHCFLWNSIDKDCEAFGDNHPCPRKCPIFKTNLYRKGGIK